MEGIFLNLKNDFSQYLDKVIMRLDQTIMVSDPKRLLGGTDN